MMILYDEYPGKVIAYNKGLFFKKQIGEIICRSWIDDVNGTKKHIRLDRFHVNQKFRNCGVGKSMLKKLIKQISDENYSFLFVYPQVEYFENEKVLHISELYEIYERLGFYFIEEKIDKNIALHEMRYDL